MEIIADLKGKTEEADVLNTIRKPLRIYMPERTSYNGFASDLGDVMQNSDIWLEKQEKYNGISDLISSNYPEYWKEYIKRNPDLETLHLVIKNIHDYKISKPEGYAILLEILEQRKDPSQRADKVIFTYEVYDGEITEKIK